VHLHEVTSIVRRQPGVSRAAVPWPEGRDALVGAGVRDSASVFVETARRGGCSPVSSPLSGILRQRAGVPLLESLVHKSVASVLAVLVAVLASGCSRGDRAGAETSGNGIVGSWSYDGASMPTPSTDDADRLVEGALASVALRLDYTFAGDGTFTVVDQTLPLTVHGTWESRGTKYVLTDKERNGEALAAADQKTVTMELKDGRLFFSRPPSPLVFRLKRK
jgi:hypothetical protein